MNAPDTTPRMASWWSPAGWTQAPEPAPYIAVRQASGPIAESYQAAGYETELHGFPPEDEYSHADTIVLYRHTDHLLVETRQTEYGPVATFFVEDAHVTPFRVTLLPAMMQAAAAVWQAEQARMIRRALIAFVRHGGGLWTISSDGLTDKDERQDRDEEFRSWQRAQAAKKRGER